MNYGAIFIIWDRMFGTFTPEVEKACFGVIDAFRSWNLIAANFNVFGSLLRQAKALPKATDRLKLWFMPPGWDPSGPKPIPRTEGRPKFDPPILDGRKNTILLYFIMAILLGFAGVSLAPEVRLWPLVATTAVIELFLLWRLGQIMDASDKP